MKIEIKLYCILVLVIFCPCIYGHGLGPVGAEPLDWNTKQISHVFSINAYPVGRTQIIDKKKCLVGSRLNFAVKNEFAFDIDEDVDLELDVYPSESIKNLVISYDESVQGKKRIGVDLFRPPKNGNKIKVHALLKRARFYDSHPYSTDFSVETTNNKEVVICDVNLRRSYVLKNEHYGWVSLVVLDENGERTPARVSIHDSSGRAPLPSNEAIPIKHFDDVTRLVSVLSDNGQWPAGNNSGFYVDGVYRARLPGGRYKITGVKGLEYRFFSAEFDVIEGRTSEITLKFDRWMNMPAGNWFSGDGHIHYQRSGSEDDKNLLLILQAEGLNVGNILQMGNAGDEHFRQYNWRSTIGDDPNFIVAPGQEDPRTVRLGHVIQLNVKSPIRNADNYLLYDEVLAKSRSLGAVTGFAHVWDDLSYYDGVGHRRGLALNVPLGLVDFVEVLQAGSGNTKSWFDFLNLGYKLTPSAGTDYPYIDWPGSVRSYVLVDKTFSAQAWFDALRAGKVFVTNGPMLDFEIDNNKMGSEVNVRRGDRLSVNVKAKINPDIDRLDRLELIEQGEVVKTVTSSSEEYELDLNHEVLAEKGTWFVVRALGKKQSPNSSVVALSAPIYIRVDGQSFWNPSKVPEIVSRIKRDLNAALNPDQTDFEAWDTAKPLRRISGAQQPLIQDRVNNVLTIYDDLLRRAAESTLPAGNAVQ